VINLIAVPGWKLYIIQGQAYEKDSEYLLSLGYSQDSGTYYRVGDYQGIYPIPTDEIKTEVNTGKVEPSDLELYYHHKGEFPPYLLTIYKEVTEKYFN